MEDRHGRERGRGVQDGRRMCPALGDRHVLWLIDLRDEQNCKILCGQRRRPKGQGPFQFFAVSIQCYSELLLLPK